MVKTEGIFLESEILKILSCVVRNLWVVQRFLTLKKFFSNDGFGLNPDPSLEGSKVS